MCGIAGILHFRRGVLDTSKVKIMTDLLAHRGPDSEGIWHEGPIVLGHRRLSIIDLNKRADQPMVSDDGKFTITYNGEIYNYKELSKHLESKGSICRTSSDTEVILRLYQLYGYKCLEFLRGMYALAIWDSNKQQLFVARDRVGIKPLYFLRSKDHFVFASEIKAIVASGYSKRKINYDGVAQYFRFLVVPQPDTIFTDIKKLEPGHYLLAGSDGSICIEPYWKLEDHITESYNYSQKEQIEKLGELLTESVKYHMVADVPVSAFLSGGLDSSAVVSLMRDIYPQLDISTFATVFPGDGEYDEGAFASKVSTLKRTKHEINTIDEKFLVDFDKICWHLDEPFAISSAYATYYLAKSASHKAKVVLTGDGGDELFAGYTGYTNDTYLHQFPLNSLIKNCYGLLLHSTKFTKTNDRLFRRLLIGLRIRIGTEGLRYSEQIAQNSFHAMGLLFSPDFFTHCLSSWDKNLAASYYDSLASTDKLTKKLFAESKTRLVDEMLMKVDRMTMAHSLEARVPLLDHKIVEYAFKIPADLKLHHSTEGTTTKFILKKAMEKHLPKDIIYRKKQGFNIPTREWLHGEFLDTIAGQLQEGLLVKEGLITREGIELLTNQQKRSEHNHSNMLMSLLAFETWANSYKTRLGSLPPVF